MPAILIADSLSQEGQDVFARAEGFTVDYKPEITPEELKATIGNYDGLVVRSRAHVTADTLENSGNLRVIGRAGVGLDNVDIPAATSKGVIVMNTPGGNTVSTAENTMSVLLTLARNVAKADASMRAGRWDKKKLAGVELQGKTVGVIGLGNIGREVVKRAKGFEMRVLGFDPFTTEEAAQRLGVEMADLETIWKQADFITVHTPLNDDTRHLINAEVIAKLKPTCRLINCARGGIIDEAALVDALKEGRIAGAALDVFETEPPAEDDPLRSLDNVVLTPHLSASTGEAQDKVAIQVAEQIVETLTGKAPRNAVNAPSIDPDALEAMRPYLDLAERMGGFVAQYVDGPMAKLTVTYSGSVLEHPTDPITTAALMGILKRQTEAGEINYINAGFLMKDRGVEVIESRSNEVYQYANLISLEAVTPEGESVSLGGTLYTAQTPRIVMLGNKHLNAHPTGVIAVIENKDVPGIVGLVGTTFGDAGINIAYMTWGRSGDEAVTIINCDQDIPAAVLDALAIHEDITSVKVIQM